MIGRRCIDSKHNAYCRSEAENLSVIRSSRRGKDGIDSIRGDSIHIDIYERTDARLNSH
jgi:hypothetical protein